MLAAVEYQTLENFVEAVRTAAPAYVFIDKVLFVDSSRAVPLRQYLIAVRCAIEEELVLSLTLGLGQPFLAGREDEAEQLLSQEAEIVQTLQTALHSASNTTILPGLMCLPGVIQPLLGRPLTTSKPSPMTRRASQHKTAFQSIEAGPV